MVSLRRKRFRCSRVRLGREAAGKLKARKVKTGVPRLRNPSKPLSSARFSLKPAKEYLMWLVHGGFCIPNTEDPEIDLSTNRTKLHEGGVAASLC